MKKTLIAALVAGMFMAACSQTPTVKQYVINGTVEGFEDGDSIMLVTPDSVNPVLGTQVIKDGKFTFSGEFERPIPVFCEFKDASKDTMDIMEAVILEDTIINVTVKAGKFNNVVVGGPLQRLFNEMNKTAKEDAKLLNDLYAKVNAPETPEAEKEAVNHQIDSIGRAICKAKVDFVVERVPSEFSNVALPPVATMLRGMYDLNGTFALSEMQRLLNAFAQKQPDSPYYEEIKKEIDKFLKENNLGGMELDEKEE